MYFKSSKKIMLICSSLIEECFEKAMNDVKVPICSRLSFNFPLRKVLYCPLAYATVSIASNVRSIDNIIDSTPYRDQQSVCSCVWQL